MIKGIIGYDFYLLLMSLCYNQTLYMIGMMKRSQFIIFVFFFIFCSPSASLALSRQAFSFNNP